MHVASITKVLINENACRKHKVLNERECASQTLLNEGKCALQTLQTQIWNYTYKIILAFNTNIYTSSKF